MSDVWGPGTNAGHGHVWKRPDGMRMRCGGMRMCRTCKADAATLAERVEAERVPALRWEEHPDWTDGLLGFSGAACVVRVVPARAGWLWDVVGDVNQGSGGTAGTRDAAKDAAARTWAAWCERAGLVPREGFLPGYKGAEGSPRTAQGNAAERGEGERT